MTSVSQPASGELLLLLSDSRARATLVGALSPPHRVRILRDSRELLEIAGHGSPLACIFDLFESRPSLPPPWFGFVRNADPYLALLAASDFSGHNVNLFHMGEAGVDGVIRWDASPSQREIVATLDAAVCAALARGILSEFGEDLHPPTRQALTWAIEHALESPQVSELASALNMSASMLARGLKATGAVSPRSILVWGRLLVASHLMSRPWETVESVAFRLGYATGGSLGKAVREHLGCSPTDLLRRGGLAWASQAVREALRPARDREEI